MARLDALHATGGNVCQLPERCTLECPVHDPSVKRLVTGWLLCTAIDTNNAAHWSRFWAQGFITTLGAGKPQNCDGVVCAFWREKFADLPNGARLLDFAADKGAIATLAAEVNRDYDRSFFIAANDLAEISDKLFGDAYTAALLKVIVFHSNVHCDRQPFDNNLFDFACAQFGLWYGDIASALVEIRRMLEDVGQFDAISHHSVSKFRRSFSGEGRRYSDRVTRQIVLPTSSATSSAPR